ncbi:galactokinase [Granulicella sp. dw_53]|uniref:galactokinase n=1 Tax=Granulicella sp. dw_53 TaxID=2719792 RepID=UPI001BD254DD|nr:galactokinase [Granulicella sp. dw_53]
MKVDEVRTLEEHFERFGVEGKAFRAPARVNLIGEHTDYTGGLVMPMAIGFQTVAVLSPREDGRAVFYSQNYGTEFAVDVASVGLDRRGEWSDYAVGVLWALAQEGVAVGGFSMTLRGDVPLGAGLSSSASVEVATAMALLDYAGVDLPIERLATACRRAENEYVGAKTGIMDQFVVAGAVAHRAMMLDCRSLEFELLPLPEDVRVVICNSMVKHRLADVAGYGDRRGEVEAGQEVVRRERPGVLQLRDATLADLEACADKMSAASFHRCRHIVTENARVVDSRAALLRGDVVQFGEIMKAAHVSMRDDFAASCAEVDTLVEIASKQAGCYGARITGGGFGGCTVNLVQADATEDFVTAVVARYRTATGISAECFVCAPADGALALRAGVLAAKDGAK